MKSRPFLLAAGLAALFIFPIAKKFLNPSLNEAYHHPHPISTVPRAILVTTLLVWSLAWLAFSVAERFSKRGCRLAWIVFAILPIGLFYRFLPFALHPRLSWLVLHGLYVAGALLPVVLIVSLFVWQRAFEYCIAGTELLYTIAGFGMLVLLPRLAFYAFRFEPPEQTSFSRSDLPPVRPNDSRIVWIMMDELSYDQVFDHRQPGLSLPNLHSFAKESVNFSELLPIDRYTENVIPALLLGRPIHELQTPFKGPISFRRVSDGSWQRYEQQKTIFGDARRLGWTTGVAGWYNPYCRLFPEVLDRCSWQYSEGILGATVPLSYDKSVIENMSALLPFRTDLEFIFHDQSDNSAHRRDYEDVMRRSRSLLKDGQIRLVFLHVPVPHPLGIYDRIHHQLSDQGDYLDNLVLADDTLGSLMKTLRAMPDFQNTTVIVSSDHSWRTFWWKPYPSWSMEEERATDGGKFDPRPVLMVRLPGAPAGQVIANPVDVLVVHPILESLLRGRMHTPADLSQLVDQQPQTKGNAQSGN